MSLAKQARKSRSAVKRGPRLSLLKQRMKRATTEYVNPLERIEEDSESEQANKKYSQVMSFGKDGRKVAVQFAIEEDPMKMMENGMEEFIYKQASMINYGEEHSVNHKLH